MEIHTEAIKELHQETVTTKAIIKTIVALIMAQVEDMIVIAAMADTMPAVATVEATMVAEIVVAIATVETEEGTAMGEIEGAVATLVETVGDMEEVTDRATIEMGGIEMVAMGKCNILPIT